MPKGYIVANIRVRDWDAWPEYSSRSRPFVARHGGRYLVVSNAADQREGNLPISRFVVIEFPSIEVARAVYESEEYRKEIMPFRLKAADSDLFLVEGTD